MEKNTEQNAYIWLNLFAVQQKLTQHCESIILQLEKTKHLQIVNQALKLHALVIIKCMTINYSSNMCVQPL